MKRWTGLGSTLPLPTIAGTPMSVLPGAATELTWTSEEAYSCSAGGAWSGSVGARGTRIVKVGSVNDYGFDLNCKNVSHASATSLLVTTR